MPTHSPLIGVLPGQSFHNKEKGGDKKPTLKWCQNVLNLLLQDVSVHDILEIAIRRSESEHLPSLAPTSLFHTTKLYLPSSSSGPVRTTATTASVPTGSAQGGGRPPLPSHTENRVSDWMCQLRDEALLKQLKRGTPMGVSIMTSLLTEYYSLYTILEITSILKLKSLLNNKL